MICSHFIKNLPKLYLCVCVTLFDSQFELVSYHESPGVLYQKNWENEGKIKQK